MNDNSEIEANVGFIRGNSYMHDKTEDVQKGKCKHMGLYWTRRGTCPVTQDKPGSWRGGVTVS